MVTEKELRARLTQTSVDDLDATYALYLDAKYLLALKLRSSADNIDTIVLARRIERAFGQAMALAQADGRIMRRGQQPRSAPNARKVTDLMGYGTERTNLKRLADCDDDLFEDALAKCIAAGALSRKGLVRQITALKGEPKPAPRINPVRRVPASARGRKTIEHMAIQIDAIARGVEELDPGEVDREEVYRAIERVYIDMGVIKAFLRKVPRNEGQ